MCVFLFICACVCVFSDEHARIRKEDQARAAVGAAGEIRGFGDRSILPQFLKSAPLAQLHPDSNAAKLAAALLTFGKRHKC